MPDADDTPTPLPPPPPGPLSDRELLERMEQWIGRIARATGSQALTLKQFANSTSEELGQLHGGVLLIDGTMQRIARAVGADAQASGGLPEPRKRRPTPTDQHELLGGIVLDVPKRTSARIKLIWWLTGGAFGVGGWILHLVHTLVEHGRH